MTAVSALRFSGLGIVTLRGVIALLAGVLVAAAVFAFVVGLLIGLTSVHVIHLESLGLGAGVAVILAGLFLAMPTLLFSTVLIFGRLSRSSSARQSSNNRWRGP
jgi:hypothetical protein